VSREAASEQHKNEASRSLLDLLLDHLADADAAAGVRERPIQSPALSLSLSLSLDVDRLQSMKITSSNTSTMLFVRWIVLHWIAKIDSIMMAKRMFVVLLLVRLCE